jgi:hypothetical protein
MHTLCDICPFGSGEKVIAKWGEKRDDIYDCAQDLLNYDKQTEPHPCFKLELKTEYGGYVVTPAKEGQIPCGGHARWLEENLERIRNYEQAMQATGDQ